MIELEMEAFILDKKNKRLSIAKEYSRLIITEALNPVKINWQYVNGVILNRYKNSGLIFIKEHAWKIVDAI